MEPHLSPVSCHCTGDTHRERVLGKNTKQALVSFQNVWKPPTQSHPKCNSTVLWWLQWLDYPPCSLQSLGRRVGVRGWTEVGGSRERSLYWSTSGCVSRWAWPHTRCSWNCCQTDSAPACSSCRTSPARWSQTCPHLWTSKRRKMGRGN